MHLEGTIPGVQVNHICDNLTPQEQESVLLYARRMNNCRRFLGLLYKSLDLCLYPVSLRSLFGLEERSAVSKVLAVLFFRIPEWRNELLKNVLTEDDLDEAIDEWRGTEFELDRKTLNMLNDPNRNNILSEIAPMLDWVHFEKEILEYHGPMALYEVKEECIAALKNGVVKLVQTGNVFFAFVESWMKYVQHFVTPTYLHWVRGYAT
eukprot:Trichotokara_eunicae@DN1227_c0_g1_i1.p1